jgi:hypothetical protein
MKKEKCLCDKRAALIVRQGKEIERLEDQIIKVVAFLNRFALAQANDFVRFQIMAGLLAAEMNDQNATARK